MEKTKLYIASSIGELNRKGHYEYDPNRSMKIHISYSESTFKAAEEARLKTDEERAYVLYMRYIDIYQKLKASREYKKDAHHYSFLLGTKKVTDAVGEAEKLSQSLKKRYEAAKSEIKSAESEKNTSAQTNGLIRPKNNVSSSKIKPKPEEKSAELIPNNARSIDRGVLRKIQFSNSTQEHRVLIIDIRNEKSFETSHVRYDDCINIPSQLITPGVICERIQTGITNTDHLKLWKKRAEYELIVMLDWFCEETDLDDQRHPLRNLFDVLHKWEQNIFLRHAPVVLSGGFSDWVEFYPQLTTNPKIEIPKKEKPGVVSITSLSDVDFSALLSPNTGSNELGSHRNIANSDPSPDVLSSSNGGDVADGGQIAEATSSTAPLNGDIFSNWKISNASTAILSSAFQKDIINDAGPITAKPTQLEPKKGVPVVNRTTKTSSNKDLTPSPKMLDDWDKIFSSVESSSGHKSSSAPRVDTNPLPKPDATDKSPKEPSSKFKPQPGEKSTELIPNNARSIDCGILQKIQFSKSTQEHRVLIIDIRNEKSFETSHVRYDDCINIPSQLITPGVICERIQTGITNTDHLKLWKKRAEYELVVMLDWFCEENDLDHQRHPLRNLFDVLHNWEQNIFLRHAPMVLSGGFSDWVEFYPQLTTNPNIEIPKKEKPGVVSITSLQIDTNPLMKPDAADKSLEDQSIINSWILDMQSRLLEAKKKKESDAAKRKELEEKVKLLELEQEMKRLEKEATEEENRRKKAKKELADKMRGLRTNDKKRHRSKSQTIKELEKSDTTDQLPGSNKGADTTSQKQTKEENLNGETSKPSVIPPEKYNNVLKGGWPKKKLSKSLKQRYRVAKSEIKSVESVKETSTQPVVKPRPLPTPQPSKPLPKTAIGTSKEDGTHDKNKLTLSTSLPVNWEKRLDKSTGRYFYLDHSTQSTHWNLPSHANVKRPTKIVPLKDQPSSSSGGMKRSSFIPNIAQLVDVPPKPMKPSVNLTSKSILSSQTVDDLSDPPDVYARNLAQLRPEFGSHGPGQCGLHNIGNTGYMNSVLQCMFSTSLLAKYFLENNYKRDMNRENFLGSGGEIADGIAVLMKAVWNGKFKNVTPRDFRNTIGRFNSRFSSYTQQDSQELLLFLMDGLHEDLNMIKKREYKEEADNDKMADGDAAKLAWQFHKRLNESIIVELFQGQFKAVTQCLHCRKTSRKFDVFMYLSIPLPSKGSCSISDCFDKFSEAEKMSGDNKWFCPNCKQDRDAVRKMEIWKLPHVLLIHFKRFSFSGRWGDKLQTNVKFPTSDLDINKYVIGPKSKSYNLYAVSHHQGATMDSGHYVASCKNPIDRNWYKYDDHVVSKSSDPSGSSAYILCYSSLPHTLNIPT